MIDLRLVLDTNVLVSTALKRDGLERTAFLLAITKPARLYVTLSVFAEYRVVLSRPESKIPKGLQRQLLQLIRNRSHMIRPKRRLSVARDPDDNKFIECADAARADYLVTGNRKQFPKFWKQTKVITARGSWTLLLRI
jgi:uncharacterized protein